MGSTQCKFQKQHNTVNSDFSFTGHLKWKGTLMGALLEIEVWSALMTLVCPVPKVHGGSAEITSSGCLRQILKNIWQSRCLLQMRCAVWKEWIFSSNTPEEKTCNDRRQNVLRRAVRKDTLGIVITQQPEVYLLNEPRYMPIGISGTDEPFLVAIYLAILWRYPNVSFKNNIPKCSKISKGLHHCLTLGAS